MSFLSASFVTAILGGIALFLLFRKRNLGSKAKYGGILAIFVGSCLVFSAMFYVFVEYVYNLGPNDWGAIGYARAAVDDKLGAKWANVRIIEYYPVFTEAAYRVAYQLPDGRNGEVTCHVDYLTGNFTFAEVQPSK